jgi:predicted dehydrogenase
MRLLETVHQLPGVEITACCDIIGDRLDEARRFARDIRFTALAGKATFASPTLVLALPDHLHVRTCVMALSYQRNVYLETPVTHKLDQNAELLAALAKSPSSIVQCGHQEVSNPINAKVRELIQAGEIGLIRSIRGHVSVDAERAGYVPVPEKFAFKKVYWNSFRGDSPETPYDPRRLFQWRLFWDYSTGLAGSEMSSMIAVIHTLMGVEGPDKVTAHGRILQGKETRETPDHISAILDYPQGFVANLSVSRSAAYPQPFLVFVGEKGWIDYEPNSCRLYREGKEPVDFQAEGDPTTLHMSDFLRAVREKSRPAADVTFGLGVAKVVHLINLSDKQGKTVGGAATA